MTSKQTCPRRMSEVGPWERKEDLDTWQQVGNDRVCSFCGSLHPADFEAVLQRVIADEQCSISLSDKGYKVYINRPGIRNASEGAIKYYKQHNYTDADDIARIEPLFVQAVQLSRSRPLLGKGADIELIGQERVAMFHHKLWSTDASGKSTLYAWTPQEDITTYELALCMPTLSSRVDSGTQGHAVEDLPETARRHFTKVG